MPGLAHVLSSEPLPGIPAFVSRSGSGLEKREGFLFPTRTAAFAVDGAGCRARTVPASLPATRSKSLFGIEDPANAVFAAGPRLLPIAYRGDECPCNPGGSASLCIDHQRPVAPLY